MFSIGYNKTNIQRRNYKIICQIITGLNAWHYNIQSPNKFCQLCHNHWHHASNHILYKCNSTKNIHQSQITLNPDETLPIDESQFQLYQDDIIPYYNFNKLWALANTLNDQIIIFNNSEVSTSHD